MESVLHLIEQALWPVVVLVLGLVLRTPLASALVSIAGRVTKIEFLAVGLELAEATPIEPPWQGARGQDIRGLVVARNVNDSYFITLRAALLEPGTADYMLVDLRSDGDEWLTSRLYLFSYMLGRLKDVRTVVFVATRGDVASTFLGSAATADVIRALAAAQPFLREAQLYAENVVAAGPTPPQPPPDPAAASLTPVGGIDAWWDSARRRSVGTDPLNLAQAFLARLQWEQAPGRADPGTSWLRLPDRPDEPPTPQPIWEHTSWIRSADLTDGMLRDVVAPEAFVIDDPAWTAEERVRAISRSAGDDVALCGPGRRFHQLIDRRALLVRIGEAAVDAVRKV